MSVDERVHNAQALIGVLGDRNVTVATIRLMAYIVPERMETLESVVEYAVSQPTFIVTPDHKLPKMSEKEFAQIWIDYYKKKEVLKALEQIKYIMIFEDGFKLTERGKEVHDGLYQYFKNSIKPNELNPGAYHLFKYFRDIPNRNEIQSTKI